MRYYCSVCKEIISEKVCRYSIDIFGAALCINHQKTVTPQAVKLSNALKNMKIENVLEYNDGFKHVDIAIIPSKLYIELDGSQHVFSPKQMCADDERDKHSSQDGFYTMRIANIYIDKDVDKVAVSVAQLANKRYREILENEKQQSLASKNEKKHSLKGVMKTVVSKAREISDKLEKFE